MVLVVGLVIEAQLCGICDSRRRNRSLASGLRPRSYVRDVASIEMLLAAVYLCRVLFVVEGIREDIRWSRGVAIRRGHLASIFSS